jgi:hypothetical protein
MTDQPLPPHPPLSSVAPRSINPAGATPLAEWAQAREVAVDAAERRADDQGRAGEHGGAE